MQKVNKFFKLGIFLVIAVAILSFIGAQSANGQITLPGVTGSPTPTIVVPQQIHFEGQLAYDCPGCPG